MNSQLSSEAKATIDKYLHLPLGSQVVQCPYFKNKAGVRAGLRVFMGKGLPEEIVEEIEVLAQKDKVDLDNLSAKDIREFMQAHDLGVDCSGFISQILRQIDEKIVQKIARQSFANKPWWRRLISRHRPIENISADLLTSSPVSNKLEKWQEMKPGDLVRARKGKHVLLITETRRDQSGDLQEFTYHHSTSYYGDEHGARQGRVVVVYAKEDLRDQNWEEKDSAGTNYTLEGLLDDDGTNGIYRLKELII